MPDFRVNIKIEQKGEIFNAAKVKAQAARTVVQINDALAQEGVTRIKARLGQVLQHPTGYYESQIEVDRRQSYRGLTDNKVVYGGWLEGVDSRNSTTRFKGYHTFRIVKQSLDQDKSMLAQPAVDEFTRRLT